MATTAMVILLNGDLGSGKTCFAQGIALGLKIPSDMPVTSPSYSLMNIYPGRLTLYHLDLYRLDTIEDLEDLGFEDFAHGQALTLIEWSDRMKEQLESSIIVKFLRTGDQDRVLQFSAADEKGEALLFQVMQAWEKQQKHHPTMQKNL